MSYRCQPIISVSLTFSDSNIERACRKHAKIVEFWQHLLKWQRFKYHMPSVASG